MTTPGNSATIRELVVRSRRSRVAELFLQGHRTQRAIVSAYKQTYGTPIGRGAVYHDLVAIREWWRESAVEWIGNAFAEEVAKIDKIERAAWDAWRRSIRTVEKKRTGKKRTVNDEGEELDLLEQSESTDSEEAVGDPRFLEQVQWCIERRIKLLGLDAPTHTVLDVAGLRREPTKAQPVTIQEVRNELRNDPEYLAFLNARACRDDGVPCIDGEVVNAEPRQVALWQAPPKT